MKTKATTSVETKLPSPIGSEKLDILESTVGHVRRGHYVHFQPVKKYQIGEQTVTTAILLGDQYESGYFVFLDSAPRKNPHYIARALRALVEFNDDIATAYYEKRYDAVELFAKTVADMAKK